MSDIRVSNKLTAQEARGLAVVIGAQTNAPVRYVQDEAERQRLQAAERHGHIWKLGEQYYAMSDLRKARE